MITITIQAAALREALAQSATGRAAGGFEYLEHALFETRDDGRVLMTTTDSVLTVEQTIAASTEGEPMIALKVETLKAVLNGLEGEVVITITPPATEEAMPTAQLKNGRRRYNIPAIPAAHFAKDDCYPPQALAVDGAALAAAINKVAYAAKEDDHRAMCQGVSVMSDCVFATDGHRVAIVDIDLPMKTAAGFIIPKKQAMRLAKHLSTDSQISLQQKDDGCALLFEVATGDVLMRTRLIGGKPADLNLKAPSGQFFDPDKADWFAAFVPAGCVVALSRITALLGKKFGAEVTPGEGLFSVAIEGADDEFAAEITGEPVAFGLNPRYVLDALSKLDGEQAFVYGQIGGKNLRPVLVTNKDQNELHYIQQMR